MMRKILCFAFLLLLTTPAFAQITPPGPGDTPDYFGPYPNYANSPLPTVTTGGGGMPSGGTPTTFGNPLMGRTYATDYAAPVGALAPTFVVLPKPLPAGTLESFEIRNMAVPGASPTPSAGNVFHAYLLRPTGTANQYTVVYDSGLLTVPNTTVPGVSEVTSFPVTTIVPVLAGDVIGFYGEGIPRDTTPTGIDIRSFPAPVAPVLNGTVSLGTDPNFPINPQARTYSFGAIVNVTGAMLAGGMRKFVDGLPGLGPSGANNLGQYLPVAVPDTTTYAGSDYYEIELGEYTEQMHSDLPPTTLRGYRQTNMGGTPFHYLGPVIVAQRDRPVRVKFTNNLPTGAGGNLFIPVDTSYMGAGFVPSGAGYSTTEMYTQNRAATHLHGATTPWISDGTVFQWITPAGETTSYPRGVSVQNVPDMPDPGPGSLTFFYTNQQSARLMFYHDHAAGITRLNVYAGMAAGYLVTDPNTTRDPITPIYGNGIPLVIQDKSFVPDSVSSPADGVAARPFTNFWGTFNSQLEAQDPTWDTTGWGGFGQLWFPHVYMPNQNPYDVTGANAMGRWDYGPWFWPPFTNLIYGPIDNPYYDPTNAPWEPPQIPGVPSVSGVPESFMDTAVVNGTAYPTLTVDPKPYRFRILSIGNDRMFNLSLWVASSIVGGINITSGGSGYSDPPAVTITNAPGDTTGKGASATATIDETVGSPTFGQVTAITLSCVGSGYTVAPVVTIASPPAGGTQATATATIYTNSAAPGVGMTEVGMVPFNSVQNAATPFPSWWYTVVTNGFTFDDRAGGVPDPAKRGPAMIQIATEGGFLPAPVVIRNQPVNYVYNRRDITVGNVLQKALFLGPAERADIIVDFTNFAGKTLILYNDAPAPVPAADPRLDYYTGDPDQTDTGGAPSTLPGYGPNTRTIMQIKVTGSGGTAPPDDYSTATLTQLQTLLPAAFAASQDSIIVPQAAYNGVYGMTTTDTPGVNLVNIQDTSMTFAPLGQTTPVLFDFYPKSIIEDFQMDYGRMNAVLGVEIPHTNITNQTSILQNLVDPPTEVIKITDPNLTPIGTLADGTQIWKITHNGVDTHAMHVHMFTVQVVNRVGWDGAIRPPDPNELGFKDTFRTNPLEDIIVALRPIKLTLPFQVPNSVRPLAPESPIGATAGPTGMPLFQNVDPNGNPVTITNQLVNFGWEYVWHCHILGHEENDMMRPMALATAPDAPSGLDFTLNGLQVTLTWNDNSTNETEWTLQYATDPAGPWTTALTVTSTTGPQTGGTVTLTGPEPGGTTYYYRMLASNTVGSAISGYPQVTVDSAPSNSVTVTTP
jgi:FtsP/CotA-like multicopper oxidase with cupredoxin domain